MTIKTTGLTSAQGELNRMMQRVESNSNQMITALLMAISANTKPYVPVDTAALINSEYREIRQSGGKIIGEIGYGAPGATGARGTPVQEYAVYVHEGPQKNWQKPGASNRYLAKGVRDTIQYDLSSIIARYST